MSAAIASCAARLISAGAGKSGKPCARLTASYIIAFRVISRITDSVKCATLPLRKDFVGVATSAIVGETIRSGGGLATADLDHAGTCCSALACADPWVLLQRQIMRLAQCPKG